MQADKTLHEQRRADQQHDRERDLTDYQQAARAGRALADVPSSRSTFAQHGGEIGREIWRDGNKPNKIPVTRESRHAEDEHQAIESDVSSARQMQRPNVCERAVNPHFASSNPSPARGRQQRLSASNWRINRARPARAARNENSRERAVERASSRLATLAQAISSTKPTAPKKSTALDGHGQ